MSLASAVTIPEDFFSNKVRSYRKAEFTQRPKQAVAVVDKKVSRKIDFPFPLQSEKWCQGDHTCIDFKPRLTRLSYPVIWNMNGRSSTTIGLRCSLVSV